MDIYNLQPVKLASSQHPNPQAHLRIIASQQLLLYQRPQPTEALLDAAWPVGLQTGVGWDEQGCVQGRRMEGMPLLDASDLSTSRPAAGKTQANTWGWHVTVAWQ